MKRRMPPLNHLRAFEAAARHQSFTKAAEELNVTQSAVSRHVRALEEHVGLELFDRSTANLRLHQAGREYAKVLTQALDKIHDGARALKAANRKTVLLIHSYPSFFIRWLLPRLPEFMTRYPDIELKLSNGSEDPPALGRDGPDVAIRFGRGVWDGVQSELLFKDELLPYCSPSLAQSLSFEQPEDLLEATLYESYLHRKQWPVWFDMVGKPFSPKREVQTEDLVVTHQCVLAGLGVSLAQKNFVLDDVAAGRLVVPFEIPLRRDLGFYLTYPEGYQHLPKVAALREWLLPLAHEQRMLSGLTTSAVLAGQASAGRKRIEGTA